MKKSTKIILPALALLCLGTAASVTGTVAWFAANGLVKATGMQVKCATSKNLIIANVDPSGANGTFDDTHYGNEVSTMNTGVKSLNPASTTETTMANGQFFVAKDQIGAVAGEIKNGASVVAGVNASEASVLTGDFAKHEFWVANSATADLDFYISGITATFTDVEPSTISPDNGTAEAISKALRVGVVYEDRASAETATKVTKIFRVAGDTVSYQGLNAVSDYVLVEDKVVYTTSGEEHTKGDAISASTTASAWTAGDLAFGKILSTKHAVEDASTYEWSKLDIYFWYEGQDEYCTANNALNVEQVDLSLSFKAVEANA